MVNSGARMFGSERKFGSAGRLFASGPKFPAVSAPERTVSAPERSSNRPQANGESLWQPVSMQRRAPPPAELQISVEQVFVSAGACVACQELPASVVIAPCGHKAMCGGCLERWYAANPSCPMCRGRIWSWKQDDEVGQGQECHGPLRDEQRAPEASVVDAL
jgi:hypothetical protein|eukprot:Tamp_29599.p2 GENE.Tamp_29599~~Tamp_29599.p2  ORF type:complete len:162 (+),score=23.99 Tamp_29599:132-617(+)